MAKFLAAQLFFVTIVSISLSGCEKSDNTSVSHTQLIPFSPIAPQKSKKEVKKEAIAASIDHSQEVVVDSSKVAGHKLSDLYSDITGIHGVAPKSYTVNFDDLLAKLWLRKLDRKNVSDATVHNAEKPLELFRANPEKMTLASFVKDADNQVRAVKEHLDYTRACRGYNLNTSECNAWKELASSVRGVDLVAYGLTELMPSAEGKLNVNILDMLLQNAGNNYVLGIPAVHDSMLSLGLYQFTSYAIANDGKALAPASRMNQYLPKDLQIPGSVIELRDGEHHRAAYLFALHNFAILAKDTSVREFAVLKQAMKKKPGEMVNFMAVSHHMPAPALRCMRSWLKKKAAGGFNGCLPKSLKEYSRKSSRNLEALEKVFRVKVPKTSAAKGVVKPNVTKKKVTKSKPTKKK